MSVAIDIAEVPSTSTIKSIYIPRVFSNITKGDIKKVFELLDLGEVDRVDLVPRSIQTGEEQTNMAFIHFKSWSTSIAAQNLADRILDPEREARLVYDDPWYWVLLPNRNPVSANAISETDNRISSLMSIVEQLVKRVNILEARMGEIPKPKLVRQVQKPLSSLPLSPTPLSPTPLSPPPLSPPPLHRVSTLTSLSWNGDGSDARQVSLLLNKADEESSVSSDTWIIDMGKEQDQEDELSACEAGSGGRGGSRAAKIVPISDGVRSVSPDQRSYLDDFGNRFVWSTQLGRWFMDNGNSWCDP
jgi:hypothetical protein